MMLLTSCDCHPAHVLDATPRRFDPTGTSDLRGRLRADLIRRWTLLRKLTRDALIQEDLLGRGPPSVRSMLVSVGADPVKAFQQWFDGALAKIVLGGDGKWLAPYLDEAAARARSRAHQLAGHAGTDASDLTSRTILSGAVAELQGIMEVVSQQAVRAVAQGLLQKLTASRIATAVADRIGKVGKVRSKALANMSIVSSFNHASLDAFEQLDVKQVGVTAERLYAPRPVVRDRMPSRVGARSRLVEVLTAGDELVCPECEDIADEGPYEISLARALIPAHPNCRCAFVPFFDLRFAAIER